MNTFPSSAQKIETCESPQARDFDFWIGNWSIQQKILQQDGTWLQLDAKTSVAPVLDGCAIIEHWAGTVQFFWEGMQAVEPMKGLSVRSYHPHIGKWLIYWMDTRTPSFATPYIGEFSEGKGKFFREWETPQGKRVGRITFSDITLDSVHWELAISSDEELNWTVIWIMEMRRREN